MPSEFERLNGLVAVDDIFQWLTGYEALQLVGEDRQQGGPFLAGDAGDARGDDDVGEIPQLGVLRQRLAGEGIEGGVGLQYFIVLFGDFYVR